MRNWLIEALGGVTQAEQQANSKSTDELIGEIKRIADLAQAELNTKNEKLRTINLLVRDLQAERTTNENERDHLKRANDTLHEALKTAAAERDAAKKQLGIANEVSEERRRAVIELENKPERKFKLDASVVALRSTDLIARITKYELSLMFTPETGAQTKVIVRTLAASKKSKDELDKIALQINSMVERFVNL